MSDVILRQGDIDRFNATLSRLVAKTKAMISVLIHKDGHLLASVGATDQVDSTSLAALISANFSSTIAVANLLGEKEFSAQFHRGRNRSIYISLVDENTFLSTIFDNRTSVDTIRVYCEEYGKDLVKSLNILYNNLPEPLPDEDGGIPLEETIQIAHDDLAVALQKQSQPAAPAPAAQATVAPRALPHTVSRGARREEEQPAAAPAADRQRPHPPAQRAAEVKGREAGINPTYLRRKSQETRSAQQRKSENALFSRVFTKKKR